MENIENRTLASGGVLKNYVFMDVLPGVALKQKGNDACLAGDFRKAVELYKKAARSLEQEEVSRIVLEELSKVKSNEAQCYIKLEQWTDAVQAATESLNANCKVNIKALFRRAKANFELKRYEKAAEDAESVHTTEGRTLLKLAKERLAWFRRILDSYRLRVQEEYLLTGDCDIPGVESLYTDTDSNRGEICMPLRHFQAFMELAEKEKVLPSWWSPQTQAPFWLLACTIHRYTILFDPNNPFDFDEDYQKRGRPQEPQALRKFAERLLGPINPNRTVKSTSKTAYTVANMENDGSQISALMRVVRETMESVVPFSSINGPDNDPCREWWGSAPYGPGLIETDPELCDKFVKRYNMTPPLQRWPRLCLFNLFHCEKTKRLKRFFFRVLLESRFGKAANGLAPETFCERVQLLQISQRSEMEAEEYILPDSSDQRLPPTDWRFDHYGLVTSLAVAAFGCLSKNEQESASIQSRLAEVLLGGYNGDDEILLTKEHLDAAHASCETFDDKADDIMNHGLNICDGKWKGPKNAGKKPGAWAKGDGAALMALAWEIWHSSIEARKLLGKVESLAATGNWEAVLERTKLASRLVCFRKPAMKAVTDPVLEDATTWDAVGDLRDLYWLLHGYFHGQALISLQAPKDEIKTELILVDRLVKDLHKMGCCMFSDYRHRPVLAKLELLKARMLAALERKDDARSLAKNVPCYVRDERRHGGSPSALEAELSQALQLMDELKTKRGSLPIRTPTSSSKNGWWEFDAQTSKEIENSLSRNERLYVGRWSIDVFRPDIQRLHLKIINGNTDLRGLASMFPHLEALTIEEVDGDITGYCLEELRHFAPTLKYLTLGLSWGWMGDHEDVLAPIGSLTNLRQLYIFHRRDGNAHDLKCIEGLTQLERLYYSGYNGVCCDDDSKTLDLSQLKRLKHLIFHECSFCSATEHNGKSTAQALILPAGKKHKNHKCEVTFAFNTGRLRMGACTEALRKELTDSGITCSFIKYPHFEFPEALCYNRTNDVSCTHFWDGVRSCSIPDNESKSKQKRGVQKEEGGK